MGISWTLFFECLKNAFLQLYPRSVVKRAQETMMRAAADGEGVQHIQNVLNKRGGDLVT